jgi:hypothetical protein
LTVRALPSQPGSPRLVHGLSPARLSGCGHHGPQSGATVTVTCTGPDRPGVPPRRVPGRLRRPTRGLRPPGRRAVPSSPPPGRLKIRDSESGYQSESPRAALPGPGCPAPVRPPSAAAAAGHDGPTRSPILGAESGGPRAAGRPIGPMGPQIKSPL